MVTVNYDKGGEGKQDLTPSSKLFGPPYEKNNLEKNVHRIRMG